MLAEEVVNRGSVVLLIDNIGVVWAAINQSSRSLPVYSVVKAVLDMVNGLGVKVKFCHTGSRSEVKVSWHAML